MRRRTAPTRLAGAGAGAVALRGTDSARAARPHRVGAWSGNDLLGERAAPRDGADERARAGHRQFRRGGASRGRPRRHPADRVLRGMERTLGEPGTRSSASAGGAADRAARDLRAVVFHVRIGAGSGARAAGRAVCAHRRGVPAVAAWLQLLRRSVGGLHRAVRHGSPDRRGDGHLSRGSRGAKAAGARRFAHACRPARCGDRGSAAAASPEGDDGDHRRGQSAADHVEPERRRGSDEAARHAGTRRHGLVVAARAGRHPGDLLLDRSSAGLVCSRRRCL